MHKCSPFVRYTIIEGVVSVRKDGVEVRKNDEFCSKYEKFCIKNDEFGVTIR